VMGGIISAWNMSVVGESFSVVMASATSEEETAGNSSTCNCQSRDLLREWGLYSTLYEEPLEASHTRFHKRKQLIGIPWDDTSIEPNIDPALSLRSLDLLLQS
jgi:hypothetical protein